MDVREKLVELLRGAVHINSESVEKWILGGKQGEIPNIFNTQADNLIANGVTVQEWISVKDRLPKGADGKSLCENVLAYFNNGEIVGHVCAGWLNGDKWYLTVGEDDHYTVWGLGAVTHWMPLPQPPKGE